MSDKTVPRPPQATLCGGAVLVGSVMIVLLAFDRMGSLGSIEAQDRIQDYVDGLPDGVDIGADAWQSVLRVTYLVGGGLGVVTGYLGFRVLQRDRGARLALSFLIPLVIVTGTTIAGGLVPAVMTVAIVLLWRPPVRDWFDGTLVATPRPVPETLRTSGRDDAPTPPASPAPPASVPASPAAPTAPPSYAVPSRPAVPVERPGSVVGAAVTAIISSSLVLAVLGIGLVYLLGNQTEFEQDVRDEIDAQPAYQDLDLDPSLVTGIAVAAIVVFLIWSLVAVVLAVLTVNGSNAARIALVVSSIGAAMASLVAVLAVFPLVVTGACVGVAVLLLRADVAAWTKAQTASSRAS